MVSCSEVTDPSTSRPPARILSTLSLSLSFFNDTATTEIYTLSLHDALPIWQHPHVIRPVPRVERDDPLLEHRVARLRSEEHTSELQSLRHLVCRLLLEKKKTPELIAKLQQRLVY